jgi:hypothetical protein
MRSTIRLAPVLFGMICMAFSIAAVGTLGAWSSAGGVHRLGTEEMRATLGMQIEDYECFEDAGCCQGLQCGMCDDCYACSNDGPQGIGTCQYASGMYCTTLPDYWCGELMQGICFWYGEDCDDPSWQACDMDITIIVGECNTITQCE